MVAARRFLHVHFNDLIDPEIIPMDADFAALVESDVPVIVHHVRLHSRRPKD